MLGSPEAAAPKKAGYFAFLLVKFANHRKTAITLILYTGFKRKKRVTPRKCRSTPPHQLRKQKKRENT